MSRRIRFCLGGKAGLPRLGIPTSLRRAGLRVRPRFLAAATLICFLAGCPTIGIPKPITPLDFPGPYETEMMIVDLQDAWEYDLNFSVFYPAAEPPPGGFPVIVFSSGWNQARSSYDGMAQQLAQHGYVVLLRHFPSFGFWDIGWDLFELHLEQVQLILDWCADQNADPQSVLWRMCDLERLGMTGHSMGGHVGIVRAMADPRVKAVVCLDSQVERSTFDTVGDVSALHAPILHLGAGMGGTCTYFAFSVEPAVFLYDYSNPPKEEVIITGADHLDFLDYRLDVPPELDETLCTEGTADNERVRELASRYMIAWFNYFIKGQLEFEAHFNGEYSDREEAAGIVTIRRELQ